MQGFIFRKKGTGNLLVAALMESAMEGTVLSPTFACLLTRVGGTTKWLLGLTDFFVFSVKAHCTGNNRNPPHALLWKN
jgi:hypothetical protein